MKPVVFCLAIASSLAVSAQPLPPKDKAGCAGNKTVSRMPGCVIIRCETKDYSVAPMPRTQSERTHQVEGEFESTTYKCPASKSPLELGRNTETALKNDGFKIHYTYLYGPGTRFYMTAEKAPHWVHLEILGEHYTLTVVKQKQMEQVMKANAEGWAQQVSQTGRVSLYGINFDTAKAVIRPDSKPVLNEVLKMLQSNAEWAMLVAGHTDNVGAADMNLTLSRQRAESVISWLAAHGIDKSRLVAAGFGDKRPIAPNTDDEGKQKNRRVDLVKVY